MFGLFKKLRKSPDEEKVRLERELEKKISIIELFPGSLEEYERLKGEKYEIVNVLGNYKYFFARDKEEIMRKAVLYDANAIIRFTIVDSAQIRYCIMGIPVRKAKKE